MKNHKPSVVPGYIPGRNMEQWIVIYFFRKITPLLSRKL